jgi:hypothetical protein
VTTQPMTPVCPRGAVGTGTSTDLALATADAWFPFRRYAGMPSRRRHTSADDAVLAELTLVDAVRDTLVAVATRCHQDSPIGYEDFIAEIREAHPGDAPSRADARLTWLLHTYADYLPAPACIFIGGHHDGVDDGPLLAWSAPTLGVVIDVVTTQALLEATPVEESALVSQASLFGAAIYGDDLVGVRHLVLDAPYESSWHPYLLDPEPLLASALNPTYLGEDEAWA